MNIQAMHEATREAVQKKFGRKKYLASRAAVRYPQSLEREYVRVVNAYMKAFNNAIADHIPELLSVLADKPPPDEHQDGFNTDDYQNFSRMIRQVMERIEFDLLKKSENLDLLRTLENLENRTRKHSIREWKKVVRQTLGINIFDDYYNGEFFRATTRQWAQSNVDLIKTIPAETLKRMTNIVQGGHYAGKPVKEIAQQIQESYNVSKSHARFIARDQMAKLNSQITQQQQADAGVSEYIWRTVGDGRVRESHKHLNNKRFKYSDPPIVDEKTGRRGNPGEDYQCRCIALSVFDIDTVVLPWEATAQGGD